MSNLNFEDYRRAGLQRLEDAEALYERGCWVGCVYLAGRAVESIFRSLIWSVQAEPTVGHNLWELWKECRKLPPLLNNGWNDAFGGALTHCSLVWSNHQRFWDDKKFKDRLGDLKMLNRIGAMHIKGDPLKAHAKVFHEYCQSIVSKLEPKCQRKRN